MTCSRCGSTEYWPSRPGYTLTIPPIRFSFVNKTWKPSIISCLLNINVCICRIKTQQNPLKFQSMKTSARNYVWWLCSLATPLHPKQQHSTQCDIQLHASISSEVFLKFASKHRKQSFSVKVEWTPSGLFSETINGTERCSPGERSTAQLLDENLAAVLNRPDVCALPRVVFAPVLFLFHWKVRSKKK